MKTAISAPGGPLRPGAVGGRRCSSRSPRSRSDTRWIGQPVATLALIAVVVRAPRGSGAPEQVLLPDADRRGGAGGRGDRGPDAGGAGAVDRRLRLATCSGSGSSRAPALINAGREVLGFAAAYGSYAAVLALERRARAVARLAAGRRHPRLHVLLRHPGAVLLHAAHPRQARVRREDPDPALGDHLLSADAHRARSSSSPRCTRSRRSAGWRWRWRWACSAC